MRSQVFILLAIAILLTVVSGCSHQQITELPIAYVAKGIRVTGDFLDESDHGSYLTCLPASINVYGKAGGKHVIWSNNTMDGTGVSCWPKSSKCNCMLIAENGSAVPTKLSCNGNTYTFKVVSLQELRAYTQKNYGENL
jgi:hypothetical protein